MRVIINEKDVKLPNFLIVGAAKCGTTSLYAYLKQHPHIFMPENKEPCFFSFAEQDENNATDTFKRLWVIRNFDTYANLFEEAKKSQIVGEASTTYLYLYEETIKNIKKYHPGWKELKIIIILRNPAERAFSHYLTDSAGFGMSFKEVIEKWKSKQLSRFYNYIDYGFYYNQIKAYKDTFDQVKIYLFEDLETNSTALVRDIVGFLELDTFFNIETNIRYNVSMDSKKKLLSNLIYKNNLFKSIVKILLPKDTRQALRNRIVENFSKKPQLESHDRKFLNEVYKDDILKLQGLIDRDLTHWIK
ncbi:MAG: sulfotransferase [Candidatus Brocadiaceae bacterium]|nr:sulfotransferase [Candidatus Brocadiaceae bacterium]